jgi:hypothetical protein
VSASTGEDRETEQPSAQAGIPGRQSGPEAERERFQEDDHADRVGERDVREMENDQDSQRWDSEQKEPRLEACRDEPLLHRRPPSERYQLDETAREDVRRADRDNRSDDDENEVERFQGSPAVVHDQQTDQGNCRSDDTADDRGPRGQVERVVLHSGEPTLLLRLRSLRAFPGQSVCAAAEQRFLPLEKRVA